MCGSSSSSLLFSLYFFIHAHTALRVREFLNQSWCKSGKELHASNLLAIISRFNELSAWTAFQVLKSEAVNDRVATVVYMVKVAKVLTYLSLSCCKCSCIATVTQSCVINSTAARFTTTTA